MQCCPMVRNGDPENPNRQESLIEGGFLIELIKCKGGFFDLELYSILRIRQNIKYFNYEHQNTNSLFVIRIQTERPLLYIGMHPCSDELLPGQVTLPKCPVYFRGWLEWQGGMSRRLCSTDTSAWPPGRNGHAFHKCTLFCSCLQPFQGIPDDRTHAINNRDL